jgi:hypothetical protein
MIAIKVFFAIMIFGFAGPWLVSQNDSLFVFAGFSLVIATTIVYSIHIFNKLQQIKMDKGE